MLLPLYDCHLTGCFNSDENLEYLMQLADFSDPLFQVTSLLLH